MALRFILCVLLASVESACLPISMACDGPCPNVSAFETELLDSARQQYSDIGGCDERKLATCSEGGTLATIDTGLCGIEVAFNATGGMVYRHYNCEGRERTYGFSRSCTPTKTRDLCAEVRAPLRLAELQIDPGRPERNPKPVKPGLWTLQMLDASVEIAATDSGPPLVTALTARTDAPDVRLAWKPAFRGPFKGGDARTVTCPEDMCELEATDTAGKRWSAEIWLLLRPPRAKK